MNRRDLDPDESPRAAFGAKLRSAREERGWTQDELSEHMEYSATHVSAVETGRKPPTFRFAQQADVAFGTNSRFVDQYRDVRSASMLEGFEEYAAQEAKAREIRVFELGVIPGLLQTPEYAGAMASAEVRRGSITQEEADQRVAYLLTRQRRLASPTAPLVHAVLDESCLRRTIGGREVMDRQLVELEKQASTPGLILQVAPFSMGEDRPFALPVHLLTLPNRSLTGYTESEGQGHLQRDPSTLTTWERNYHRLQVGALSEAASLDLIRAARKELT